LVVAVLKQVRLDIGTEEHDEGLSMPGDAGGGNARA
jgi:hypothetical protein